MKSPLTLVLVAQLLLLGSPAQAYGDPGSGALLWQMAGAILVGAMFYVRRIVAWFSARFQRREPDGKVPEDS